MKLIMTILYIIYYFDLKFNINKNKKFQNN